MTKRKRAQPVLLRSDHAVASNKEICCDSMCNKCNNPRGRDSGGKHA